MTRTIEEIKRSRMTSIITIALRKGVIQSKPCEVCGITGKELQQNGRERNIVHAHHDNYNEPLMVRWLCKSHHTKWHHKNEPIRMTEEISVMMPKELYQLGLKQLEAYEVQRIT